MKTLGATYPRVSGACNAELRLRWGQIVLKNDYQEDFWKVKDFLQSQVGVPLRPQAPWALSSLGALWASWASLPSLQQRAGEVGPCCPGRQEPVGACPKGEGVARALASE